jgi:hypothetical protein
MNVDIEIYMSNIVKFFRDNPDDLLNLVPKSKEKEFYNKIKETATQNYDKGDEISLTRPQMIGICVDINRENEKQINNSLDNLFLKTMFGEICMN